MGSRTRFQDIPQLATEKESTRLKACGSRWTARETTFSEVSTQETGRMRVQPPVEDSSTDHELLSRVSRAGQVCEGQQGMRAIFRQQTSWKASACCQDLRRAGSVSRVVAVGRADQRTRAVTRAAVASLTRRASRSRWCTRGGRW